MATTGISGDNRSQFFITFAPAAELYKKHTLFGKVVGDTIYNLLNMEKLETNKEDRPLYPPRILNIKVLENPFKDIFTRDLAAVRPDLVKKKKEEKKQIKPKRKKIIQFSFDQSSEEDEIEEKKKRKKIVCPHELLKNDQTLSFVEEKAKNNENEKKEVGVELGKRELPETEPSAESTAPKENLADLLAKKGIKVSKNKNNGKLEFELENEQKAGSQSSSSDSSDSSESEEYSDEERRAQREKKKKEYDKLNLQYLKFKEAPEGTYNPIKKQKEQEDKKLLSRVELKRYKYLKKGKGKRSEAEVLDGLAKFKAKLKETGQDNNWAKHKLKFHIDSANAYSLQENKNKALGIISKGNL